MAIIAVMRGTIAFDRRATTVERVRHDNPRMRLYRFEVGSRSIFVAWLEPEKLMLSGEQEPSVESSLKIPSGWSANSEKS